MNTNSPTCEKAKFFEDISYLSASTFDCQVKQSAALRIHIEK